MAVVAYRLWLRIPYEKYALICMISSNRTTRTTKNIYGQYQCRVLRLVPQQTAHLSSWKAFRLLRLLLDTSIKILWLMLEVYRRRLVIAWDMLLAVF